MVAKLKVVNYRHIKLVKELQNKVHRLKGRSQILFGSINKLSNGWSREDVDALVEALNREIAIDPLTKDGLVSSDGISRMLWPHLPRGGIKAGRKGFADRFRKGEVPIALVSNVLRVDLGFQSNEYNRTGLQEAGETYPELTELNKHLRLGAGGLCFCTVLGKVTRKKWVDGKFAGPQEVELFVVPNSMLSILFGDIENDGGRGTQNLPQSWKDERDREVQAAIRGASAPSAGPSRRRDTKPNASDAALTEAYGHLKNDELRAMCEEHDLATSGKKLVLLRRLSDAGKL